ncbi:MAG TPA: glutamate--tRNA ligase [Methylomirabilota bacterium]|jgi:glutamyl-tRNA synthetase|nr:glutamate--tRNA ligase [Methylomirabilota bacterium]
MAESIRVRFAPSPTGHLHVGGGRTALFNWLFARHAGGVFLLRIEDTDRSRSTDEAIRQILDALRWLGLDWDPEGPEDDGQARGYFRQTSRLEVYRAHAERLLAEGRAYRCYCTAEELDARRAAAQARGETFRYDGRCRDAAPRPGVPAALRLRIPDAGTTVVPDLIHGAVTFENAMLDDWILVRSDGTPTYNFCVVVDDVTMKITHVIRGNDHLSNTPKQILCYEALGYPRPTFAHVPMILGPDRKRLSKRHGATSVLAYRDEGFLPEAMVNYLARLGWAHGDQEVFTREELVRLFDIRQVGSAPAIFDRAKLEWLNQVWEKRLAEDPQGRERLAAELRPHLERAGIHDPAPALVRSAVTHLAPRAATLVEMVPKARFYFVDPAGYDPAAAGKLLTPATASRLDRLIGRLSGLEAWTEGELEGAFRQLAQELGVKLVELAQPARLALTGETASPPLFAVMADLGRDTALRRLRGLRARVPAA